VKCKDPFIVFASFAFRPRQAATALPRFKELFDFGQESEPKILRYIVPEDKEANQLRTVEMYEKKDYLRDVHVKSHAVSKNREQNENLRVEGAARAF
jgi:quinol monooxygenase YgiN